MRGGSRKHGMASDDGEPLESFMAYTGPVRKMFAGCDGNILDITTPADPDVAPTPDVTGQTSNYYSHLNMTNAAATSYLLCANGTDDIQTYDGSAWAALLTGSNPGELDGVDSDAISQLNAYRNRVWLVEGGTLNAYYLPTDSIAGTVSKVSLAGVFRRGGSLLFTATWSLDAGDGFDDKIVFASTEGEIAVYQGDPSDTDVWGIVGLYDCAPPLGKNAFMKVAGDLLILTEIGLVPLSQIVTKDPAALALAAVSRNIQPDWVSEARARRNLPWEIVKWASRDIAYVTCPVPADGLDPICFAVNLETGKWARITGWDTRCMILHEDQVYFGTNDGRAVLADTGGTDQGALIYYTYVGHMDHLGAVGQYKTLDQVRAVFKTKTQINPLLTAVADYEGTLPSYPSAANADGVSSEWDVGQWDIAKWDAGAEYYVARTMWESVGVSGFAHAPVLLLTSGSDTAPTAELVVFEATYDPGDWVV